MNKAGVVFEKMSQLDATREGAEHLNKMISKHMVKSYAEHGNKGMLRQWKNQEILEPVRQMTKWPSVKGQAEVKSTALKILEAAKKTWKALK